METPHHSSSDIENQTLPLMNLMKHEFSSLQLGLLSSQLHPKSMEKPHHSLSDVENQQRLNLPFKTSMTQELSSLRPLSSHCCIYRVPHRIRHVNEKAYTPHTISIGPLHHGSEALRAMEEHKWRYLQHFIRITQVDLQAYIDIVKGRESSVRDCYADSITFLSDDFVKLILLDAVFIIEILLRFHYGPDEIDCIFYKPRKLGDIIEDLLLLENQIPFFIIDDIYERAQISGFTFHHLNELLPIRELCHIFCRKIFSSSLKTDESEKIYSVDFKHFVELARKFYIPLTSEDEGRGRLKNNNIPTATELHQAGVRLKMGSGKNLFDIKFDGKILEIPKLLIQNQSETLNRNVLAFEQLHFTSSNDLFLTNYFILMERLVKTPKDLELLVKYGIVEHTWSDSSVVSTIIQKQVIGISMDPSKFYFATLCETLEEHCRGSWHLWKANLRQNYFKTPWTILSVIAAVVILILTFIQTVCSILSLKNS